jgi:ElaB/YqjD/DUF883 family membrane-anchored ribosome-binding protein
MAIAKQRADEDAQQLVMQVNELLKKIGASNNPQAAGEEALEALQTQINGAKKKAKKNLQQTFELLQQRLSS